MNNISSVVSQMFVQSDRYFTLIPKKCIYSYLSTNTAELLDTVNVDNALIYAGRIQMCIWS